MSNKSILQSNLIIAFNSKGLVSYPTFLIITKNLSLPCALYWQAQETAKKKQSQDPYPGYWNVKKNCIYFKTKFICEGCSSYFSSTLSFTLKELLGSMFSTSEATTRREPANHTQHRDSNPPLCLPALRKLHTHYSIQLSLNCLICKTRIKTVTARWGYCKIF
jgi:hypothetical protein